ncbi:MBOAT family O-acyltransferase [Lachnoclostridium phytofermentans]|uniref:Membrane bound O-acyl transferase MBOAT family protein n=1 Tax=Lachnoclostridium phytofermentans (strain ATCC 700394 / DSM 18823 / ISDg) TaxID=357809 RepID=A9KHT7_LACP7|nr:MBOAT family protein [Lachnoclostridium phytofermentans]ABX43784.1 membrane bound O-acyl transferase MBOAT family protein [Lachnoclostridium phytofermentans ISDg]
MIFSSSIFLLVFLPFVLIIYYTLYSRRLIQNIFLFLASLLFYAWGEPWFVLIMLLSILVNYVIGLNIDLHRNNKMISKILIIITLLYNLSIIFIYKYLAFTVTNINVLFSLKFPIPNITLPIGISFFTFQAISYVIDVYRGQGIVQKNPLNVGLYIALFPQLIAGPIVRYETIADQIDHRRENITDFSDGCVRFIIGLSKKVLLSNNFAIVADKAFTLPNDELSTAFAWLGAISYSFQILFDFSGYSDMAIGLGKMFGFHFDENFNYPYISASISEFWRRWHISLGSWFRDYVYFPLGGSRVDTKLKLVRNLFIVWILTGVWHGANWTFIAWGFLYFVLITVEKLARFERTSGLRIVRHIYTLFFVCIGWVLFRAIDLPEAFSYLGKMFGVGGIYTDSLARFYFLDNVIFIIFAIICSTPLLTSLKKRINYYELTISNVLTPVFYILLLLVSITYIVKGAYNPFIYFNF